MRQTGTSRPWKRTLVLAMLAHSMSSRNPRLAAAGTAWQRTAPESLSAPSTICVRSFV
jgi:hypothetical protein